MREVTIEERFHGTCILAILHLRRLAHSNDIEAGFAAAHELKMINFDHDAFIRGCLATDELLQSGAEPDQPITDALVKELQACVLRLNSADPA